MLIIPPGADAPLRGDLVVRAILRSDLTPVPQTIEVEVRDGPECTAIQVGAVVRAGRELTPFRVLKVTSSGQTGRVAAGRPVAVRGFVAAIDSCAPVAEPRSRPVVSYGTTIGAVYRSCGARVAVDGDVQVAAFVCLSGMVPSFAIAQALQEAAGAVVVTGASTVAFRRIRDMLRADPVRELVDDAGESVESNFLERHAIPWAFSIGPAGSPLFGPKSQGGAGRPVMFRPGATQATLNNLATALVTRRKIRSAYAPDIAAGDVLSVAGVPHVVVTAAHVFDGSGGGVSAEQYSTFWLAVESE